MINSKYLDSNNIKIDEKSYKNILYYIAYMHIFYYYIAYVTAKRSRYLKIKKVNLKILLLAKMGTFIKSMEICS